MIYGLVPVIPVQAAQIVNGRIAFMEVTDPQNTGATVNVMNEDGSNPTVLTPVSPNDQAFIPSWAPDGKRIAYTHIHQTNPGQIDSVVSVYIETIDAQAGASPIQLTLDGTDELPVWSPDGQYLYYTHINGTSPNFTSSDVYRVKADGSAPPENVGDPNHDEAFLDISPDGTKMVYSLVDLGTGTTGSSKLYVQDLQTHQVSQLVDIPGQLLLFPQWSPDGSKIAIFSQIDDPQSFEARIYIINADGSNAHAITPSSQNVGVSTLNTHMWSPDSSKVLYTMDNFPTMPGTNDIYMADAETGQDTAITSGENDYFPNWSADGQKLAFTRITDTNAYIYTMDIDGSHQVNLTPNESYEAIYPVWETRLTPSTTTQNGVTTMTVAPGEDFSDQNFTVPDNTVFVNNGSVGDIVVSDGGTFKGSGTAGDVIISDGGTLAPGNSPGCLAVNDLTLQSGANYDVEISNGTACSGYDQVSVTGTVTLNNAQLNTTFYQGGKGAVGNSYTIIQNDGSDPISGGFANLPEGATFIVQDAVFKITYKGGDGNDVVLTQSSLPTAPNTGLSLLTGHPLVSLMSSTLAAGSLYYISRRSSLAR